MLYLSKKNRCNENSRNAFNVNLNMNQSKTALVTGASGGLGLQFARLLAADGYNLVLVARNEEALKAVAAEMQSLYGVQANCYATDLAQPDQVEKLIAQLEQAQIAIDCLINNAGFGDTGHFAERPWAIHQDMIQLNMLALTRLTHALSQGMIARKQGRILNIASTAAFQPSPNFAVYAATKSYVLSFSEALAYELKNTGVSVTVSCPGPTETAFHDRAATRGSKIMRMGMMKSETVALQAYLAMKAGKRRVVHGMMNRLLALSTHITPNGLLLSVTNNLMKP